MSEKIPNNPTDHMWETHMQTLMKRKRNMEVKQIIDEALFEWYSERGLEVPQWRMQRNPEWWISYLNDLGIDPQNP
jgi:hypothetical protein